MKLIKNIRLIGLVFVTFISCFASCDYLDVVPPEQPGLKDAMRDHDAALGFLYSCYGGVKNPINYSSVLASTDEYALPQLWNHDGQRASWDALTAPSSGEWIWGSSYRFIGQCYLFLRELEKTNVVSADKKVEWKAETDFLIAYYHFLVLSYYGPCPITDGYIDETTSTSEYHGRYHFDYVVDWIATKLDAAATNLPAIRKNEEEWGRATSTMAKALKARLLLYAASKLWNGDFPNRDFKNKNFETPGYGKDLVSFTYDKNKWIRAEQACKDALDFALNNGERALLDVEVTNNIYKQEKIPLPFVPGVGQQDPRQIRFLEKVLLMRYLVTTKENEGNREIIWGIADQGDIMMGSLPKHIVQKSNGTYMDGYSGVSPYLYTIEHFYTQNGKLPSKDPLFYPKEEWFRSASLGRVEIIKLNTSREPRFYAWMSFDGDDYSSKIRGGEPLRIQLRNGQEQGYNPSLFNRDHCVTGYLSKKYIMPNLQYYGNSGGDNYTNKPKPLIRLAELYLNLAECQAELGKIDESIGTLNIIRNRAGIPELSKADITTEMPLMDWVRNERFVELWGEGHRYFDLRRWMIAPQKLDEGVREGLNAEQKINPTFDEFNQRVKVAQPYKWNNRMYLGPIYLNEVYKNPQMIQAPGY